MLNEKWKASEGRSRQLMTLCAAASYGTQPGPAPKSTPSTVEDRWSLLVYAIAGSTALDPGDIGLRHLRFRISQSASPDALEGWLCACLQRLGHGVRRGSPISIEENDESAELLRKLVIRSVTRDATADEDPVLRAWHAVEFIDAHVKERPDGPATGTIETRRFPSLQPMTAAIDLALTAAGGGYALGAAIRFRSGTESLAGTVESPLWSLDSDTQTVSAGPPSGYFVSVVDAHTGLPSQKTMTISSRDVFVHTDPDEEPCPERP
ncbi:hypothetical protein [Streptomyces sp. SID14515]|uniref:hypothetical protein n=1 Tax=Streptomyces sp. SID14515 TaxID=2706074 RepID=UPI0013DED6BF|nr:hypothetical protein [Streptomyces sp. SID14515]